MGRTRGDAWAHKGYHWAHMGVTQGVAIPGRSRHYGSNICHVVVDHMTTATDANV